ncbi:hypothetical protein HPA07_05815 [Streptococcus suis]|uniref:hypothetical protein n=1 Tax=Streptococcus suis TaxID=1307 RepID=UPI0005CDBB26|nr:hypothetical protein [Streptococcus suis]MDY7283687.1 hypothetical protein [Streptococcus suis]NQG77532.1 hypothetical protein [Streptococcus suis]NQH60134.1 hypothetical protein [Streptococcus suis]NQN48106.1 hypothetical protein [Streptococcus suis]NQN56068.1 hypothetical protein [Streptococcus suis]
MVIFELKDCNILNIYNSFTDGYYDECYYGCPTCGGADVPDTFALQVISDKFDDIEIIFFEDEAKNALHNFLPWILKNIDNFKDVTFEKFVNEKIQEICMEETDETK